MLAFSLTSLAILGTIVGSFLNVVMVRLNTGMTFHGRSQCFSCRGTLRWFELIPVISFLIQKGRCRRCQSKISKETLYSELITGIVFAGIGYAFLSASTFQLFDWITILFFLIIMSLLLVIAGYDIHHKIVPDVLVIPFIILSFLSMFFIHPANSFLIGGYIGWPTLWHALSGLIIPLPFFLLWLFSKGKLMGFGDIKLMAGVGWLLGLAHGVTAVIISFWVGAIITMAIIVAQKIQRLFSNKKRFILSREIPFAPFLVVGIFLVIVFRFNLFMLPLI